MTAADLIAEIDQLAADELPRLVLYIAAKMAAAKSPALAADEELLDVNEARQLLGISKSALYHAKAKDFPFVVKVGGSRRYSRSGIQKFIEKRQRKA